MILHADLDAFYASVAQRDDPSLRGKPVAVSGSSRRAVVLTASYEARPFGVRSAMPLYMARERCPQLIVVPPDFTRYRAASRAAFDVYRARAVRVEGLSLDEAFLDLGDVALEAAIAAARTIKDEVRASTELAVSVGIAANKMVAKIACDDGKPDGLKAIEPGTEREYLGPKPVGALWGVGPKTQARLADRGIERIEQIASLTDAEATELFGRWGVELRGLACGVDTRPVSERDEAQSISTEMTFEHDLVGVSPLEPIVREQAQELGERLQRYELRAYTVGVKIKTSDFTIVGKQTSLREPTDDARAIGAAAVFCLRRAGIENKAVRLVGVKVSALIHHTAKQISLFT